MLSHKIIPLGYCLVSKEHYGETFNMHCEVGYMFWQTIGKPNDKGQPVGCP